MKPTLIIIALTLLVSACQKEEQQTALTGSIGGTLSTYDPATPLVTTPLEGIKLWLVDYDYPFDTVTYMGNEQAILDSTYSDAQGNYNFTNLPFGNYIIAPVRDTVDYHFEPTDPDQTLPISLTESNPAQQISFSTPWPQGVNTQFFYIHLKVIPNDTPSYFTWGRQYFIFSIPFFVYIIAGGSPYEFQVIYSTIYENKPFEWGWFGFAITTTNNFLFDFYELSSNTYLESYWITQDLGNTPAESWWTIDLAAHTITQDSISANPQKTFSITNQKTLK